MMILSTTSPKELSTLYDSNEFNAQFAYKGTLGVNYSKTQTSFTLWAPIATAVTLRLYSEGTGDNTISDYSMQNGKNGSWHFTLQGDYNGIYYTYIVANPDQTSEVVDLYTTAVGLNGRRGMVVDLQSTNPEGWELDSFSRPQNSTDCTVWEVHISDFSSDIHSGVSAPNMGKYLAFTESDTTLDGKGKFPTCLNYLKKLGVTHVQLLPIFDYASVDEGGSSEQFNWGYDPLNYNAPEGSYSTNPASGAVRINECKQMIQALHSAGIGVIMDVVYNHTYDTEQSWFHQTVPYYFHRTDENGNFANGSACGNETASERFMCRRFIIDSVLYWAREYHLDGFRFDLMGLHDVDTMNLLRKELDKLPNGDKILLYGEPWYASAPKLKSSYPADKANLHRLSPRIGAFCDNTRDSIKGDVFKRRKGAFVNGGKGFSSAVKSSLGGWVDDRFAPALNSSPLQTVSYVSCHDNLTLWDKLVASTKGGRDYSSRDENIVAMNKLCAAIYILAQGMPFMQAGEEFARTKLGVENSYRSLKHYNNIYWARAEQFSDLTDYYKGLLEIRKQFPMLRDITSQSAKAMVFSNSSDSCVAFTLKDKGSKNFAYCCNAGNKDEIITLQGMNPQGTWDVLADDKTAGVLPLYTLSGDTFAIPAKSCLILYEK